MRGNKDTTKRWELKVLSNNGKVLTVKTRDYVRPTSGPEILACRSLYKQKHRTNLSWFKWVCADYTEAYRLATMVERRSGCERITAGLYGRNRPLVTVFYSDPIVYQIAVTVLRNNCKRYRRYASKAVGYVQLR